MNLTKRVGLLASAAALTVTGGVFADATNSSDDDLRARLAEAEARLAELETKNSDNWLTENRAEEIRSLVQDVLADADTRASLLNSGMTAGYDNGFNISSADGNFSLTINGQLQTRWILNYQSDSPGNLSNDSEGQVAALNDQITQLQNQLATAPDVATQVALTNQIESLDQLRDVLNNAEFLGDGTGSLPVGFTEQDYAYGDTDNARNAGNAPYENIIDDISFLSTGLLASQFPNLDANGNGITGQNIDVTIAFDQDNDLDLDEGELENAWNQLSEAQQNNIAQMIPTGFVDNAGNPNFFLTGADVIAASAAQFGLGAPHLRSGDKWRSGFENTRTKLWFHGHVVNPQWFYMIEANFDRGGGEFFLLDAYLGHDYGNGWKVMMGQYKSPLLREELVDARYQQAVERSLFNSIFTAGRVQGLAAKYNGDQFRAMVSLADDGVNRSNSVWSAEDTEWSAAGRVEFLAMGNWEQFDDFRSLDGDETGLLIGAAFQWEKEEYGTGTNGTGNFGSSFNSNEVETWTATVDASLELGAFNIYGAFAYRNVDPNFGIDYDQWGFMLQGGWNINADWEIFARYEFADLDVPDVSFFGQSLYSFDDLNVVTVGFSRYFAGHQIKWTTDFGYAIDRVEFFAVDDRAGYRSDTGGDSGQMVLRTQLQLLF